MKPAKKILYSSQLLALSYWLLVTKAFAQDGVYEDDVVSFKWLEVLFQNILSIALRLIGVAAFIMLLVGGFRVLTSGGDPEAAAAAKSTITQAVIGIVVAIAAWFILVLIGNITGIDLTTFSIDI